MCQQQGFAQGKVGRRQWGCVQEAQFELCFGIFGFCLRGPGNAAAGATAHMAALPGWRSIGLGVCNLGMCNGANGYVEQGAIFVDEAHGSAIHAARLRLGSRDFLHGHMLGRAGDGAAGKQRLQHLGQAGAGPGGGLHGAGHLPQGGVRLGVQQLRHVHAAGLRNAPQVVAQQINDHDVFGTFFGAGLQRLGLGGIGLGRGAARGGAFHGAGGDGTGAAVPVEKQFGRERQDAVVAKIQKRTVAALLALAQGLVIQPGRKVRVGRRIGPQGVIDLVQVAGGNGGPQAIDFGYVIGLRFGKLPLRGLRAGGAGGIGRDMGGWLGARGAGMLRGQAAGVGQGAVVAGCPRIRAGKQGKCQQGCGRLARSRCGRSRCGRCGRLLRDRRMGRAHGAG